MPADLTALRDRLAQATGADREMFGLIGVELGLHENATWWARFERLLAAEAWESAALALVERVLPGWRIHEIRQTETGWCVFAFNRALLLHAAGNGPALQHAMLDALLAALQSGGER